MFSSLFITALFAACISASPMQRLQQEARVVTTCTKPNTAALTFDDGPWVYAYDVSKALVAANATGTFFFNGNNYACIYDADEVKKRVQYVYRKGHQVASHTWSHRDLTTLTWDQIQDEMWRVERPDQDRWGRSCVYAALYQPALRDILIIITLAYGNYNSLVLQASFIRGQVVATWDLDSGDSVGATPAQSKASYDQLVAQHPGHVIALNHETIETTVHQVLPYAIQKLQAAGYRLVSLAECTGLPAYQNVGAPGVPDSSLHC